MFNSSPIPSQAIEIFARIPSPSLGYEDWLDGPEGIAQANDGNLVVGSGNGWLYRVSLQGEVQPFVQLAGWPLGLAIDRLGYASRGIGLVCNPNHREQHFAAKNQGRWQSW